MSKTIPCPKCAAQVPEPASGDVLICPGCGEAFPRAVPESVREADRPADRAEQRARAAAVVRGPALALIAAGVLGVPLCLFQIGWHLWADHDFAVVSLPGVRFGVLAPERSLRGVLPPLIFLVFNGGMIVGGLQMLRLRHYALALLGTVLALLNFNMLLCLLNYPVGGWSFLTLLKPEVKRAFAALPDGRD